MVDRIFNKYPNRPFEDKSGDKLEKEIHTVGSLTPKFRGARLAWSKRAVVEASPATHS